MTEKGTRKSKYPRTKKSAIKKISSSRRQLDHYLIFTIKPWNARRRKKGQKTPRNKMEAHTFVIPLPTFTRNDAASILKKSKKKKNESRTVAEFLEVSECVLDFRGRPSATLLCIQWPRKAYPFTLRAPSPPRPKEPPNKQAFPWLRAITRVDQRLTTRPLSFHLEERASLSKSVRGPRNRTLREEESA